MEGDIKMLRHTVRVTCALALALLVSAAVVWTLFAHPASTPITVDISGRLPTQFDKPTTIKVKIKSVLDAPDTIFEIVTPEGVNATPNLKTLNLKANQPQSIVATIVISKSTPKGNQAIYFRALRTISADTIWGDMRGILFNVTDTGIVSGWSTTIVPVAELTTPGSTPVTDIQPTPWHPRQDTRFTPVMPKITRSNGQFTEFSEPSAILIPLSPGTVTLRGRWMYHDRSGVARPIDQQVIEIRRGDGSRIGSGLFPCFTAPDGSFECSFNHPGSTMRVWVRSWTNFCNNASCSDTDRLGTFSGNELSCGSDSIFCSYPVQTGVISCADGATCDIGTWTVHTSITGEPWVGAHQISQDLIRSNKKAWFDTRHPGAPASPGDGRVNYPVPEGHGTHAHVPPADGWISIEPSRRSGDTVNHEYGHVVMANWYAGASPSWPTGDCPSPHYYRRVSGSGCAFSEGFANFWALYSNEFYDGDNNAANDGPIYNWFSGASTNTETRDGNTYDNGDRVEGNVAAALWDIYDSADDDRPGNGIDQISDGLQHIWHTTYSNNNNNFAGWWDSWKSDGSHSNCDGVRALVNNTINYTPPNGCSLALGPELEELSITSIALAANPLKHSATFVIQGAGIVSVQLEVYNLAGRRVFDSGDVMSNTLSWSLHDQSGRQLANGVYLYVIAVKGSGGQVVRSQVRKLVILR
jgi:hypothetical protein